MYKPITLNRASNTQVLIIALLLAALVLATANLFVATLSVVLLILAGLLFGVFVHGLCAWPANRFPISYHVSYLVVVVLMLLTIGLGCFQLGSQVARRTDDLWTQLQSAAQTAEERLDQNDWANEHLLSISEVPEKLTQSTSSIWPEMFQGLQWFGWGLTGCCDLLHWTVRSL